MSTVGASISILAALLVLDGLALHAREREEPTEIWSFRRPERPPIPGAGSDDSPQARPKALAPDVGPHAAALEAWYLAETLDGRDDSPIARWTDSSGKGRDLVPTWKSFADTVGTPPRFLRHGRVNGHPAVRFADRNGLGCPGDGSLPIVGDAAYTFVVVTHLEPPGVGDGTAILVGVGDGATPQPPARPHAGMIEIHRESSTLVHAGGWGHNATLAAGSARALYDGAHVLTLVKRPGAMAGTTDFFVDGRRLADSAGGSDLIPELRRRDDWCILLGHAIAQLGSFRGDVSEVLLFSEALDNATRSSIEEGLIVKYSIDTRRPRGEPVHPIDAFVDARLAERGLAHAEGADRRTLIRRASFDLLGLPPSPERVEAFVADRSPDAWERLIDELLESKRYGERWGRHWLDVARYADTGGYETDIYYRNAWRYRDWVVKSFNDDKPYDRFVREQIAGDELWPDNLDLDGSYVIDPEKTRHLEARVGTGFYALGPQIHESNMDAKKLTLERLTDWVDTTGSAFLALTLSCARCHDHKFDPVSQRDYYSLQAVFASSREVNVPVTHGMGLADFKQHYPKIVAVDEARRAYRVFESRTAGKKLSEADEGTRRHLLEALARSVLQLPTQDAQGVPFDGLMETPTATVLGPLREALVPSVHVLSRGDLRQPLDEVGPGLPTELSRVTQSERVLPSRFTGRRKELALWITRSDHPLTARVIVNRIWQWHFGRGIVATANDFGAMGTPPSHPRLLDWLATEIVARGWSIKSMHRLIMTSRTYRRSSAFWTERHERLDPRNTLLWRMNRRRLEGEAVWDAIHSVAGTINLKMGGRPVMPPLVAEELTNKSGWVVSADPSDHTRRGIYIIVRRNFRFPLFDTFDAPVNAVSCAGREVSTVAPQALWLLNNRTAFGQATAFAARVVREAAKDSRSRIERAFGMALGRPPSDRETSEGLAFLASMTSAAGKSTPLANLPKELAVLPRKEAAALTKLCLTILNLSEFLFVD